MPTELSSKQKTEKHLLILKPTVFPIYGTTNPPTLRLEVGRALNLNDLVEGYDIYFE
jgi:hypothetical protein